MRNCKIYLQITSGRGPAECGRVVALTVEKILTQAKKIGLDVEVVEREPGEINRTLFSAVISIEGLKADEIVRE